MKNLIENIDWIKDIITTLFSITAIIITVLTYRRARHTILQPIRSEVIKKQTQILIDILEFINDNSSNAKMLFDYNNLMSINEELFLRNFGLKSLSDEEKKFAEDKLLGKLIYPYDDFVNKINIIFYDSPDFIDQYIPTNVSTLDKPDEQSLNFLYITKRFHKNVLFFNKAF